MIRVLVVDDNDLMRRGLSESISVEPDMEAVGAAQNALEAVSMYRELHPDVVTMDYQMPGENGIECTQMILDHDPNAKVILISIFDSEEDIWNAVQAGVQGYLTKKAGDVDVLIDAIRSVAEGDRYFPATIARKLAQRQEQRALTPREIEVLKLLAEGNSNKDICDTLNLSMPTIKFHVQHLREKLNAVDRTDTVVRAIRKGILRVEE